MTSPAREQQYEVNNRVSVVVAKHPSDENTRTRSFLSRFSWWLLMVVLAGLSIWSVRPPPAVPASAPPQEFSAERALVHIRTIAQRPHPMGSSENAIVREYLLKELIALGMNPQVLEGVGARVLRETIVAGKIHDIAGRLPGTKRSKAIMLMAHYDSVENGAGAADDGAGVSAILETVRALRNGAALENDLIVLFTDGEEAGLLGAESFTAQSAWMKDVGLVLNFEARGNAGPSLLFETTPGNEKLMRFVQAAADDPVASSMFYSLYKLLPNDTDLTVFRSAQIPGLNFAFGNGLQAYHTSLDTPALLSTASLQHHGAYALSLVRHFGSMDLARFAAPVGDDAVFFTWPTKNLVVYSARWVLRGIGFATAILLAVLYLSSRRTGMKLTKVLGALICLGGSLLLTPLVLAVAWLIISRVLVRHRPLGDTPGNACLLISLVFVGGGFLWWIYRQLGKYFAVKDLSQAGACFLCLLNWWMAMKLPAGSYFLFWPFLLLVLAQCARELMSNSHKRNHLLYLVLCTSGIGIAVMFFAQVLYLIYVFLTLDYPMVIITGGLLGILVMMGVPLLNTGTPQGIRHSRFALVILSGAAVFLVAGAALSGYTRAHPLQDSVVYFLDADSHSAAWISRDRVPDSWLKQVFGAPGKRMSLPNYLGGSTTEVLAVTTSPVELPAPEVVVRSHEEVGNIYMLHLRARSPRHASTLQITFDSTASVLSANIAGRSLAVGSDPKQKPVLAVRLYGVYQDVVDIDLKLKANPGSKFWILDQSAGLPIDIPARPDNIIGRQSSDMTLVCRRYSL